MTFQEAKQALARKLNIDYSKISYNNLFSDTDLGDYIQAGSDKAWDYKPWNFKETIKTITAQSGVDYYDYPVNIVPGSIFLLRINGKSFRKRSHSDYLTTLENNPNSSDKIWSEFKGLIFINKNAYGASQLIDIYAKSRAPQYLNASDLLPFSIDIDNQELSGNRAIVQLAYGEALSSDKKKNPNQALLEERKGFALLDSLWSTFAGQRTTEQIDNTPFFDVPDYFNGNNGGSSNIGKF